MCVCVFFAILALFSIQPKFLPKCSLQVFFLQIIIDLKWVKHQVYRIYGFQPFNNNNNVCGCIAPTCTMYLTLWDPSIYEFPTK